MWVAKGLIGGCYPYGIYLLIQEIRKKISQDDELLHPAQLENQTPLLLTLAGLAVTSLFVVATVVIYLTIVKRVYFCEATGTYRFIVGGLVGNRHVVVNSGGVQRSSKWPYLNHTVNGKVKHLTTNRFSKNIYYKHLLGEVDLEGNSTV